MAYRLGVDTSNYTGPPSNAWEGWPAAGVGLVAPQAINPPPGYPAGCTHEQCQWTIDHGLLLTPYIWKWFGLGTDDIRRRLDLLSPFEGQIDQLWLDVEDTSIGPLAAHTARAVNLPPDHLARIRRQPPPERNHAHASLAMAALDDRLAQVQAALELCDSFGVKSGLRCGVYTGGWFWGPYMGGTTQFADRDSWPAQYDGVPDPTVWSAFGGWQTAAIKQYIGTSSLTGVGGVDLNVLAENYLSGTSEPGSGGGVVDQGWLDKKDMVVSLAGELKSVADQLKAEATRKGGPRRPQVNSLAQGVQDRADRILA